MFEKFQPQISAETAAKQSAVKYRSAKDVLGSGKPKRKFGFFEQIRDQAVLGDGVEYVTADDDAEDDEHQKEDAVLHHFSGFL